MILTSTPLSVWYLIRGSGLVALVLFSSTIALGVVGVRRWQSSRWARVVTAGLHRNLALLASCFLAIHVVTAVVDSFVGLGWIGVIVPFRSTYRPLWVGMGVLAFDLVLAVMATSLLRRHLAARSWRLVHWLTWLMWPIAVVHGLGSGTDHRSFGLYVCLACIAVVAAAGLWRLTPVRARPTAARSLTPPDTLVTTDRRAS